MTGDSTEPNDANSTAANPAAATRRSPVPLT